MDCIPSAGTSHEPRFVVNVDLRYDGVALSDRMNTPELSVIICTYNGASRLSHLFAGLAAQDFPNGPISWELLLVDNNSTDQTRQLVTQYSAKSPFPIRYVFEPHPGKSHALNRGIKEARACLLAFSDDDVVLDRHWLASVHEAFIHNPQGCFGGKVVPAFEAPLPEWLSENGRCTILGGPVVSHNHGDEARDYDGSIPPPIGANMFVRKALFDKYGTFRTDLGPIGRNTFIYGEDTELMMRFKNHGEAILYYPKALVIHPAPLERLQKSYFKKYFWGLGRAWARIEKPPADAVRYGNVPRYVLRQAIHELLRLLTALPRASRSNRFRREVDVVYYLGMIYEYYIHGN